MQNLVGLKAANAGRVVRQRAGNLLVETVLEETCPKQYCSYLAVAIWWQSWPETISTFWSVVLDFGKIFACEIHFPVVQS